jgi:hypothetical protein
VTKEEAIQIATTFVLADPDLKKDVDATKNNAKQMSAHLFSAFGVKHDPWAVAFPYASTEGFIDNPDSLVVIVDVDTKKAMIMQCL